MKCISVSKFKDIVSNETNRLYQYSSNGILRGYRHWFRTNDKSLIPKIEHVSMFMDFYKESPKRFLALMYTQDHVSYFRTFLFKDNFDAMECVFWMISENIINRSLRFINYFSGDTNTLGEYVSFYDRPIIGEFKTPNAKMAKNHEHN